MIDVVTARCDVTLIRFIPVPPRARALERAHPLQT